MNVLVKNILILLAKFLVTVSSFALLIAMIDLSAIYLVIRDMRLEPFILALLIFWLAQIASAQRFKLIVENVAKVKITLTKSLHMHFVGLWFNQVLPSGLGGDVVKGAIVQKSIGLGKAVRCTLLDRFFGLLFLLACVFMTLPFYHHFYQNLLMTIVLFLLTAASIIALIVLVMLSKKYKENIKFAGIFNRIFSSIVIFFYDVGSFGPYKHFAGQAWTSAIVHFNAIVAYALIGMGLGIELNFMHYLLLVPLLFLIALAPISIAGWGVREIGAVGLFSFAEVSAEQAAAMSILWGVLLILASLPGALLMLAVWKKKCIGN